MTSGAFISLPSDIVCEEFHSLGTVLLIKYLHAHFGSVCVADSSHGIRLYLMLYIQLSVVVF